MSDRSAEILKDLSLLYELSLSMGDSLDTRTICDRFLKTLMARKNLDFTSVWVRKDSIEGDDATDRPALSLLYANPTFRVRERTLPAKHALTALLARGEAVSVSCGDESYSRLVTERGIGQGSFALFPLQGLGVLKAFSSLRREPFAQTELSQLRNVVSKFAVTLRGALSHQRVVREIAKRERIERIIRSVVEGTAALTGEPFFHSLTKNVAAALGARYALISEFVGAGRETARALAFWKGDHFASRVEYQVEGSPCAQWAETGPQCYPQGAREMFPQSKVLSELRIESLMGLPILDSAGAPLGYLAVLDEKPMGETAQSLGILKIFATRAGAELERMQSDRRLRLSEERYRILFEDNPSMYITVDQPGRIASVNAFGAGTLGCAVEELIGRPVIDAVHEDDRASLADRLKASVRDVGSVSSCRFRMLRKDGAVIWVEGFTRTVRGRDGAPHTLIVCHDISESVRAEQASRESEARYRAVVEQSRESIFLADLDSKRVLDANASMSRLLGYSRDELLSMSVYDFFSSRRSAVDRELRTIFERGDLFLGEKRFHHRDGTPIHVEASASVIAYAGKQVICVVSRDMADRIRAERERRQFQEQLQQAQKLESLGVLAGGVAHDFNNLLTGIMGNAQLAELDLPQSSRAVRSIENIKTSASHAADLCAQLLAYSGKGRFVVQPLNLNHLIDEMIGLLEVTVSSKAMLRSQLAPSLPAIEADAAQMRQVIMNLIANAAEATKANDGIITITTGVRECDAEYFRESCVGEELPAGRYVFIEVSDTGEGMDAETRKKVFEPFFTTKFTGRGLGLAAVLGIVRGHRGAINIYSETGVGTTFKVLFPSSEQLEKSLPSKARHEDGWRGWGSVLVVDDEEMVRDVGRAVLERAGFTVIAAANGLEAVELFERNREEIRLVLLDMTMPQLDGEGTFRELRRIRGDVPVILTSGYNEQEATSRFVGKGLAGFLQKPYELREVIGMVRDVLQRQTQRR